MKPATLVVWALCNAASVLAQQDPGPSPTNSVGCVPHNGHWDCEGPATGTATPVPQSYGSHTAAAGSLPPSPTASVGCVAHGNHWDCEGPATSAVPGSTAAAIGSAMITTILLPTSTSSLATVTPSVSSGGGVGMTSTSTSSLAVFTGGAPVASFDTIGSVGLFVLAVQLARQF